jgi:pilus assembly protein TadC
MDTKQILKLIREEIHLVAGMIAPFLEVARLEENSKPELEKSLKRFLEIKSILDKELN